MAKVYEPTTNLFALLAEDEGSQAKKAKSAANKGQGAELTPKERAEAKAVQDAERKAQREAEKARKEAEAARRKANLESLTGDVDTGFALQRHQRIKAKITDRAPEGTPKTKGDNKPYKKNDGPKGDKPYKKNEGTQSAGGDKFVKGDKQVKTHGGARGEGKDFNKPKTGEQQQRAPRGRDFDKHSQGVTGRKFNPKKGGSGRGNWDNEKNAPEGTVGTTAEEAVNSEALAAKDAVEGWGEAPDATPAVEGEEVPAETDAEQKEEEEEDKEITLEEYQALQDAKKKEFEAQFSAAKPRSLTDEETRAAAKFTRVENTKGKKPETVKAAPSNAPKKEKKQPVVLEINVAHPPRSTGTGRGRGGRFGGRGGDRADRPDRADRTDNNQQKKGRVAKPVKLPRGGNFDSQFPTLA